MTTYMDSPTLSSPSQYTPTHHGHGHGYGYGNGHRANHHRGQPSLRLSSAPLRSALASECVQSPKRDQGESAYLVTAGTDRDCLGGSVGKKQGGSSWPSQNAG